MEDKNQLTREQIEGKTFSYKKGEVSLRFDLRVDTVDQLKDFKEILEAAIQDINSEIESIKFKE